MRSLTLYLLVSVAVVGSLLGCAMPLCALGAAAAYLLPRRSAYAVVALGWIVNQVLGFTMHGYPHTRETLAWGLAIGLAAFGAAAVAAAVVRRGHDGAMAGLAFAASFVAFELTLVCASLILGGWGAYTAPVVAQLFALNALWFVGAVGAVLCLQRLRLPSHV